MRKFLRYAAFIIVLFAIISRLYPHQNTNAADVEPEVLTEIAENTKKIEEPTEISPESEEPDEEPTPAEYMSPTPTCTHTPTPTPSNIPTPTEYMSPTPTMTLTPSPTMTPTPSPSNTPTPTEYMSPTPTMTLTPSPTMTPTPEPSVTPVPTDTPTVTQIPTITLAPTVTPKGTEIPAPTEKPVIHVHNMKHVPYKAATQTSDGNKEYYYCESCGKWFWDAEGVNEITNKSEVIIPRTGSASSTGSTVSTGNNPSVRTTATPGTGDDTPSGFYLAMMAIAALGLILILTQRFRKDTH